MISTVSNMMFLITYLYRYDIDCIEYDVFDNIFHIDMISTVSNMMFLITYLYRYDIDCIEYDVFDNIFI